MFNNLEESKIENGNFTAEGDSTMFEESKKLDIGGGFYLATTERKGKGVDSDSEGMTTSFNWLSWLTTDPHPFLDEGPKMFQGLEESTLRDGVFVAEGRGQMFKKSKKLIIEGGNYTASGTGTKARKSKNTAKPSQQGVCIIVWYFLRLLIARNLCSGYGSPLPSGFPGTCVSYAS
jgi:hypothetical protein